MARCKATALRVSMPYDGRGLFPQGYAFDMSKKYEVVRDKIPLPGGGFVEAFRMALVDLSCFGEGHRLDLTGYPHESEAAAMQSDWAALGVDFRKAADKVLADAQESSASAGRNKRPGQTDRD